MTSGRRFPFGHEPAPSRAVARTVEIAIAEPGARATEPLGAFTAPESVLPFRPPPAVLAHSDAVQQPAAEQIPPTARVPRHAPRFAHLWSLLLLTAAVLAAFFAASSRHTRPHAAAPAETGAPQRDTAPPETSATTTSTATETASATAAATQAAPRSPDKRRGPARRAPRAGDVVDPWGP